MEILFSLALLFVMFILWNINPLYALILFLAIFALVLLDTSVRRPGLFWSLLGLGVLFSLLGGDGDDCDL